MIDKIHYVNILYAHTHIHPHAKQQIQNNIHTYQFLLEAVHKRRNALRGGVSQNVTETIFTFIFYQFCERGGGGVKNSICEQPLVGIAKFGLPDTLAERIQCTFRTHTVNCCPKLFGIHCKWVQCPGRICSNPDRDVHDASVKLLRSLSDTVEFGILCRRTVQLVHFERIRIANGYSVSRRLTNFRWFFDYF